LPAGQQPIVDAFVPLGPVGCAPEPLMMMDR
jgi:hypothetical protein